MIAGAVLAALGGVLCLLGSGFDWLVSLAGFSFAAGAAIQNGRKKQSLHPGHHIIRIMVFSLVVIGMYFI